MYTFTLPNDLTNMIDYIDFEGVRPFKCYVYSSSDSNTARSITSCYNTLHGDNDSEKIIFTKYVSPKQQNPTPKYKYQIEVPVHYWGPHDADAKLSIEVSVVVSGSPKYLVSDKFAAMVAN
jgi:hypothetical protein